MSNPNANHNLVNGDLKPLYAEYDSYSDKDIVKFLLSRDPLFTEWFLFHKAYPLLMKYYKYYGNGALLGYKMFDDFVRDFYIFIMSPSKKDSQDVRSSKLGSFQGRSSLFCWLKVVCHHFCCDKIVEFKRSLKFTGLDFIDPIDSSTDSHYEPFSENNDIFYSQDFEKILSMMPNQKYAFMLRQLVLNQLSEKELADLMGVNKYFYVMLKRAKEQFTFIQQKETLYNV